MIIPEGRASLYKELFGNLKSNLVSYTSTESPFCKYFIPFSYIGWSYNNIFKFVIPFRFLSYSKWEGSDYYKY